MKILTIPTDEKTIRELRVGEECYVSGTLVTARDMAIRHLSEQLPRWAEPLLRDTLIYHCGPVMRRIRGGWEATAAGPSTSIRQERYQADVMRHYRVRGVIGKGGMGPLTIAGLREVGGVYLHTIGGAAALLAQRVEEVEEVHLLDEFGMSEAMWVLRVKSFPAIVTMDSLGQSWHDRILEASRSIAAKWLG